LLQNTFLHIPGIAKTTEKRLWKEGCATWEDLLANPTRYSIGSASRSGVHHHLERSQQALQNQEHQYFRPGLGIRQAWRAFPEFRDSCVYLDIETDGTGPNTTVTMIGLWDGKTYTCLMHGEDIENFRDVISHYSMIVTFFGHSFDLPVLQQRFPGLEFDQIHIDLCPTLAQLEIRGGLKKIEKQFGIQRSPETDGLTGRDAIFLWRKYKMRDDEDALKTLIAYNREDCVNLEVLAEQAYSRLKEATLEEASRARVKSPVRVKSVVPIADIPKLPGLE
jgi:uncharacterized protein YprB with RNaseH-like and TPR domain